MKDFYISNGMIRSKVRDRNSCLNCDESVVHWEYVLCEECLVIERIRQEKAIKAVDEAYERNRRAEWN